MGRRWGKTVLGGNISLATAAAGGHVAWIVPTYKNGRPLWRWAEATTAHLRKAGLVIINRAERMIEFDGGGFLGIYSGDNGDGLRGEAFHLAVIDEAARIGEDVWTDVIQPTLADYGGDALLISTPNGRNWFWQEWMRGQDPLQHEYASWSAPSSDNPNPRIKRAAELARDRVSQRTYEQEWLAAFVEDSGVFRRVREACSATPQARAVAGHQYVIGVDWAREHDFTVLSVIDSTLGQQVALDRFNQVEYTLQKDRLRAMAERFPGARILAEENSIGNPLIADLRRTGLPIYPFVTTNASKADAVDALALAFERGTLTILPDAVQQGELVAYEATKLPSGLIRYSAPEGMHDDCVMALMIAWQAAARTGVTVRWIQ